MPKYGKISTLKIIFSVLDFTSKFLRSLAFYWYQICLISERSEFRYWCHIFMELPYCYFSISLCLLHFGIHSSISYIPPFLDIYMFSHKIFITMMIAKLENFLSSVPFSAGSHFWVLGTHFKVCPSISVQYLLVKFGTQCSWNYSHSHHTKNYWLLLWRLL